VERPSDGSYINGSRERMDTHARKIFMGEQRRMEKTVIA
jgi:hypothetical protein